MAGLSKEQFEDLLDYVVQSPSRKQWKGDKMQFCCTVHGESNPSCGINIDYSPEGEPDKHYQVIHCFSCGFSGTIPWFVLKSLPDRFKNIKAVDKFLKDRYGVTFNYTYDPKTRKVRRYDEREESVEVKRFELPRYKLAPFKSGKETYQYFFDRGFTKEDMKEYMIGRDLESETITIPAFWEDGVLAGVIGRYIDPSRPHNSRYKIYEFPKGTLLYPLDKFQLVNDTIIGVESMFDAIMLRKWGYPNVLAMMGGTVSRQQADLIASKCRIFIDLFDNDEGGLKAREIARKRLGNRVIYKIPSYYPEEGKDPSEWGEIETVKVISSASYMGVKSIPRL